jgi:hypothetical protein
MNFERMVDEFLEHAEQDRTNGVGRMLARRVLRRRLLMEASVGALEGLGLAALVVVLFLVLGAVADWLATR